MNPIQPEDTNPLVSIIITTYNHGKFIRDAIESAFGQTYKNIEVLIVDDGSTDNTNQIVLDYPSAIYLYQHNQGISAARNNGLKKVSGEYVLFLDADDFLYPDGIAINVNELNNNPDIAFVSGSYKYVDINKKEINEISHPFTGNHFHMLILTNCIEMHGTVLYRKKIIEKYLYDVNLKCCEDYDLFLRITKNHKAIHHTEFIAAYRRVGNSSLSSNIPLMLYTLLKVIKNNVKDQLSDKRINYLYNLSRKRAIEIYANKAKRQLVDKQNGIKKYTKIWFQTLALVLRFRFYSFIKYPLKKVKNIILTNFLFKNSKKGVNRNAFKIFVLMYHKIANPIFDPWDLSVSKENFESHLKYLCESESVINTEDLLNYLNGKKELTKNQVYITFDDGYEDNAIIAAPLLENYQIPATFFITNKSLSEEPSFFWSDILEIIFLTQLVLPNSLSISTNSSSLILNFEGETNLENIEIETLIWKGKETLNKRTEAYIKMWNLLIGLQPSEQDEIIKQLIAWSKVDLAQYHSYKVMNKDLLMQLKNNKFIEIGGHTKSHVSLSQMNSVIQEDEIENNKIDLERFLKKELSVFAYPYGRTNSEVNNIVSENGYNAAFTCVPLPIVNEFDKMNLGRHQVINYDAHELEKMLTNAGF
jgi:glycosyltransferase involved in cell wall biosynthesis/peptidoglycan/xylan/chitin deacetylase (PgdA/CDA1 family)